MYSKDGVKNYFNIDQAKDYVCRISVYTIGKKSLYINVWERGVREDGFYLFFGEVIYLSGPTSWSGTIFDLAPDDTYLKAIKRLEWYSDYTDEKLLDPKFRYRLYTCTTKYEPISIIAYAAELTNDPHPTIKAAES
jgi:hypothetical protein